MNGFLREHVIKRYTRSSKWRKTRKEFLRHNPLCSICGKTRFLQVHHIIPVHLCPELELDWNNLITLCSRHHFIFGHLENWKKYNKNILKDINFWRNRLDAVDI